MTQTDPTPESSDSPDTAPDTAADTAPETVAEAETAPETAIPEEADTATAPSTPSAPVSVSPFDPSVYGGISDSYTRAQARMREADKKRARTLGVFVTAALLVGGLLGGTAGGAFAIWNLSSRGLVTPGAPPH